MIRSGLHVRRCVALSLLTVLLGACGVSPLETAVSPAAEPSAASAVASAAAQPSAAPVAQASAQPSAAPSVAASVVASAGSSAAADAQAPAAASEAAAYTPGASGLERAYTPLVLLEAAAVAIEEAARQATSGEGGEVAVFTRLIAVSILVGAANAALGQEPPIAEVAPVWEEARAAGEELGDITERWAGQQITAEDASAELDAISQRIETIVQSAEAEIAATYNVDPAELERLRNDTIARLEQALASPAP